MSDLINYFETQLQDIQEEFQNNGELCERTYICNDFSHLSQYEINEKIAADIAIVITTIKSKCTVVIDENEVKITTY